MKKIITSKLRSTKLFSVLLGVLTTFTLINSVNATERDGNSVKKKIETFTVGFKGFTKANVPFKIKSFESTPATGGGFTDEDAKNLGNKGYIYPYDEAINNTNGDFVYEDYNFEDFALMHYGGDPNDNTQFAVGQLEKNLLVSKEEADGVTSWTITFYPKGKIYNDPYDLDKERKLVRARAGVAFTKDIEILNDNLIHVETFDTKTGEKIGEKNLYPNDGTNNIISDAEMVRYTADSEETTGKNFFGGYYDNKGQDKEKDINLRTEGLKTVADNHYAKFFNKCLVFQTAKTDNKKWVITFKTKENPKLRQTLNVFKNNSRDIKSTHNQYISGVMAGIGSWERGRTVAGVNFMGKHLSDKVIYTETIQVNEKFLTNKNTLSVPARTITFDKATSLYYNADEPITYSVPINESFAMPSGEQLSGPIKNLTTKYTLVDYEQYDSNALPPYVSKHTNARELQAISETISSIEGYTTQTQEESGGDRTIVLNVMHRANNYSNPEDEIKVGLDDLTKQLTAFINNYPVGVGTVTVQKSTNENLDNVPTQAQLDELKAKQDEIEAKINEIKAFIEKNAIVLGSSKKANYDKLINAYSDVFNGLNKESVKQFGPKYNDIKDLNINNITSPEYSKPYSEIIKGLNKTAMDKLRENTSFDNMFEYLKKANAVKSSPRYNDASEKRKEAFDEAFLKVRKIFTQKYAYKDKYIYEDEQYGNATLPEVLEAKRALNEAIINLDRPDAPPVITAPRDGDTSVTATVPTGSKVGDVIKIYRFENGNYTEIGSYTLKKTDLSKKTVEVPLNPGVVLTKGETIVGRTYRDYLGTENSTPVKVQEALICTQSPTGGRALNTKVGISTLNRGDDNWNLNGLGAYLVLESNTKGFVITRNADPEHNIQNPVEGMLVFDTTAKCLKLYSSKTGIAQWNCIKQGCNHK